MIKFAVIWDLEEDPEGNLAHIAEHGITKPDVEDVLTDPENSTERSRNSDRNVTFGETRDGRYLAVVWETALEDPLTAYPVTAFSAPRPRKRPRGRRT